MLPFEDVDHPKNILEKLVVTVISRSPNLRRVISFIAVNGFQDPNRQYVN